MNVACTACPAKYAVPDDRVRGKRVRITCKHCGTGIIVDGTQLGPGPTTGSVVSAAPNNGARERRKTMLGIGAASANAAAALGVPLASAPAASKAPATLPPAHGAWLVALADGKREPASQARIVDLFAAGTIGPATYLWREDMPEWKTPFEIPEIAAALRARGFNPRTSIAPSVAIAEEEATRVSVSPLEELAKQSALSAPSPAKPPSPGPGPSPSPTSRSGSLPALSRPDSALPSLPRLDPHDDEEDAEGVTVAIAGPPPGLVPRKEPSAVTSAAPFLPGQRKRQPTLPPLGPRARVSDVPPPNSSQRGRGGSVAGQRSALLRPSPAPPSAPAASAFGARAASAPLAAPAPFAPPPPPPPVAPPAVVAPQAPAAQAHHVATAVPAGMPIPAAPRSGFDAPARAPLPSLDENAFRPRRGGLKALLGVALLAGLGAAGYSFWSSRQARKLPAPPPPAPVVAAPTVTTPPPSPTPTAEAASESSAASAPSSAPSASASAAPKERAASPARVARRDESAVASRAPRKADTPGFLAEEAGPGTSSVPSDSGTEDSKPALAEGPEFNRDAAAQALSEAAQNVTSCRSLSGPMGPGQVTVTFAPSGKVTAANVSGDYAGTSVGICLAKLFRSASVPAFGGEPVTVSKRFSIE